MTDLRTYSAEHVGQQWTEADHIYLIGQLDKIDRLVQDLADSAFDAPVHRGGCIMDGPVEDNKIVRILS